MKQRYASIAAASLAALVVGVGPAAAQTSPSDSPSTPGGSADTISPSVTPNPDARPSKGGENTNTRVDDNGAVNDESPSASPRGDDDATSKGDASDRQQMKDQQQQIDQNTGLDRADSRK